ncbi:TIGR04255 family protein [Mycobacteroides abscessus]|uniref:TIGR04255 family protein n=1 Tax=Mycobacteroides abscessus TaxID=36809 RepID=UPI0009A780A1|nr:TIGR04255 family protein [Mycobacteroides abscessus]RIT54866.1 TIGR04255 family protein [Mycobacteroides abscessus]SLE94597.1 Uncharacterised protein [Mycobacteroides abscessus subsp. bolletii]
MTYVSRPENFDGDLPLGALPPAGFTMLAKAPVEVAVAEVRFSADISDVAPEVATTVRDAFVKATRCDLPTIQEARQRQLQMEFGSQWAPRLNQESRGWQLVSANGDTRVTLMPDTVILQTGDYVRWSSSVKSPLSVLLSSIESTLRPTLVHRVGLRYVDRFRENECTSVVSWRGKIDVSLLGPIMNATFGDKIRGAQQQIEIFLDEHHSALLRHGPVYEASDKTVQYLLDTDVFNHSTFGFDVNEVIRSAERLNRTALSLFRASVSDDYLRHLQGEGATEQ